MWYRLEDLQQFMVVNFVHYFVYRPSRRVKQVFNATRPAPCMPPYTVTFVMLQNAQWDRKYYQEVSSSRIDSSSSFLKGRLSSSVPIESL